MKRGAEDEVKDDDAPKRARTEWPGCSEEQKLILHTIEDGERNIFVPGVAGTGKKLHAGQGARTPQVKFKPNQFTFVAPTGTAAINIAGVTVHSTIGCGVPKVMQAFRKGAFRKQRDLRQLKFLVLDETSMVSGSFLDAIDFVLRTATRVERPFGGVRLLVCGDFAQLGPIEEKEDEGDTILERRTTAG